MSLTWRKEPPDCVGWWWVRDPHNIDGTLQILPIIWVGDYVIRYRHEGANIEMDLATTQNGHLEWAGPIQMPEDRK